MNPINNGNEEITALAERVFNDSEKAQVWLIRPNHALGDLAPLFLLDTDTGIAEVKRILGCVEYGVFS